MGVSAVGNAVSTASVGKGAGEGLIGKSEGKTSPCLTAFVQAVNAKSKTVMIAAVI